MFKTKILYAKRVLGERRQQIVLTIIVFFIALISFGLGYIAARDFSITPIVIEKCSQ